MGKKTGIVIAGVLILLITFCIYQLWPIKTAVKTEKLKNLDKEYYLVEWELTTGSGWVITGDQNGEYPEAQYIFLQGELPDIVNNSAVAEAGNVYICYGEYIGTITQSTNTNGNMYIIDNEYFEEDEIPLDAETLGLYNLTGWDILYPVKRKTLFPFLPKSCLTRMDMSRKK